MNKIPELERVLKALANKRRLMIVRLLLAKRKVSVSDIADHLKLSMAATSRHLRQLAGADLVDTEQINTTVNYSLVRDNEIISILKLND